MSHRCRPRLVPLSIADRVAEHQHGVDVLPTPAHASPLEPCFDDHLVGAFHTPRTKGPACLLIGLGTACALHASASRSVSPGLLH